MTDNLELVLKLLLDESAKAKTVKGVKEVKDAVTSFDDKGGTVPTDAVNMVGKTEKQKNAIVKKLMREAAQERIALLKETTEKELGIEKAATKVISAERQAEIQKSFTDEIARRQLNYETLMKENREKNKLLYGSTSSPKARATTNIETEKTKELDELKKKTRELFDQEIQESDKLREAENKRDAARRQAAITAEENARKYLIAEALVTDEYRKQMREITVLRRQSEMLGRTGRGLTIGGLAVVGGAFALASKEAQRQKEAGQMTAETKKWLEAQLRIQKATERIGRVAETTILPYLVKAAALAERASKYLDSHPEVAKAVLSAGVIAVGLGSILTIASKGIRMYADLKYEAAQIANTLATERNTAALVTKSLVPGGSGAEAAVGSASKLPVIGKIVVAALAVAAMNVAMVGLIKVSEKTVEKLTQSVDAGKKFGDMLAWLISTMPGIFMAVAPLKRLYEQLDPIVKKYIADKKKEAKALDDLSKSTENEIAAMKVLADLAEQEAKAERNYADDRKAILDNATRDLEDSNRNLARNLKDIASTLVGNIKQIGVDLRKALSDLDVDFKDENLKAAEEYQQDQADIIAKGAEDIQKIREQAQKDLEQLELDHARAILDATRARDAGALEDANTAYEERKNEINQGIDEAISQARENTAAQLAEAARNYEEQAKQRREDYEKQKQEIKDRAKEAVIEEKARAEEAKKRAIEAHKEEQAEIKRKQAEALADLKMRFNEEQRERVLAANAAIKDLGTGLNAELILRRKYYNIIQTELNKHLAEIAASFAGIKTSAGGKGVKTIIGGVKTGSGGIGGNSASNAVLSDMIGNRAGQQNIAGMGSGITINWVDQRRFDADVSLSTRKAITEDTIKVFNKAIEKAKR